MTAIVMSYAAAVNRYPGDSRKAVYPEDHDSGGTKLSLEPAIRASCHARMLQRGVVLSSKDKSLGHKGSSFWDAAIREDAG